MDMTKAIMGENAVHTPFNFVRQQADKTKGLILGQETGTGLAFGSTMPHVLVLGDMIFRPRLAIESRHLVGVGAAGIIASFQCVDDWIREGNIILDMKGSSTI